MSQLKKLISEAHRRSLWQVLGIYVVGSWLAFQAVQTFTEGLGLPDWVPPLGLVLLIIGLPIVVATAFVQEGLGSREGGGEPQPAPEYSSQSGAPVQEAPESVRESAAPTSAASTPAGVQHRLFTWRNAIVSGVLAFALLGLATAGYMAMRTLGIGPAATLIAQGVLEEGAKVVLADFESASDAGLGDVVTEALRIDLLQSPTIQIVERSQLEDALQRMQREGDTPLTSDVSREIAVREGYGAVIEGEVGTAGSGYVLTAQIVGGENWTSLAAFRTTAKGDDDLVDAIERLSRDIRDKAGESLRTVQGSPPLRRVSTASLDALRAYSRAKDVEGSGDRAGGLELYERAVEIDPDFAMAYRKIGVMLANMRIRRSDEIAALTRAYELRDRLTESERYQAEAFYHLNVIGDRDATTRAYESLLGLDPEDQPALNNLGLIHWARGRFEEAEQLFVRAVRVEPFEVGYSNVASTQVRLGRFEDAAATLDTGVARLPGAAHEFERLRVEFAAAAGDFERADSLAETYKSRFTQPPSAIANGAANRFLLDAVRGRLRAAERELPGFEAVPNSRLANPMRIATYQSALHRQRGDNGLAVGAINDALAQNRDSLAPGDRLYSRLIQQLLLAEDTPSAEVLNREWRAEIPYDELGDRGRDARRATEARLAHARGRPDEAIRLWEVVERECPGWCDLDASLGLARTYEAVGDAAAAAAQYERFLASTSPRRLGRDASERGRVLERLGQLYDEQDDLENAVKYYAMFVELWAEADEELQPRVRAAQARLEEILRERG